MTKIITILREWFQQEQNSFTNPLLDTSPTMILFGGSIGLYLFNPYFWMQILLVVLLEQLCAAVLACAVYYIILPNRGTTFAYIMGFGIICPLCLCSYSIWIVNDLLQLENAIIRFTAFTMIPVISTFHCIEAMFGFSPHSVETSVSNYILYTICGLEIEFDAQTRVRKKSSMRDILTSVNAFVQSLVCTGLYNSMLRHVHYAPFPNSRILNNVTCTIYAQLFLTTFLNASTLFLTLVYRVKVVQAMKYPTLCATSPSDFWGNRWNLHIHGTLKRGVFKPIYKYTNSKAMAIWATFIASGLFHEYILYGTFMTNNDESKEFVGWQLAFFLWNAGVVSLEHVVGHYSSFKWIATKLPRPIVTFLVIFTTMPIAHWFLHPLFKVTFFQHADYLFPILVRLVP